MKPVFVPDQFVMVRIGDGTKRSMTSEEAAEKANSVIERLLGPEAFLLATGGAWHEGPASRNLTRKKARLFGIEEIRAEKCEHEPQINYDPGRFGVTLPFGPGQPKCRKCGARLRAVFKEVEG